MIRKTLLVISMLLLVGTLGLWVRSYWSRQSITLYHQRPWSLAFGINKSRAAFEIQKFPDPSLNNKPSPVYIRERFGFKLWCTYTITVYRDAGYMPPTYGRLWSLRAPTWFVEVLFALPLAVLLPGIIRERRLEFRRRHNLCLKCGYDLTGNVSGRCSECGTVIEPAAK